MSFSNSGTFRRTGGVAARCHPCDTNRMLTVPAQLIVVNLVLQKPTIYLHEIQAELQDFLMLSVSMPTIFKFLHKSGFSCQQLLIVALQQQSFFREEYTVDVSVYSTNMFVFVDKTGADRNNSLRKHGFSIRGKPAINITLLIRGERVSTIACMSVNGALDVKTLKQTSNGDTSYKFV